MVICWEMPKKKRVSENWTISCWPWVGPNLCFPTCNNQSSHSTKLNIFLFDVFKYRNLENKASFKSWKIYFFMSYYNVNVNNNNNNNNNNLIFLFFLFHLFYLFMNTFLTENSKKFKSQRWIFKKFLEKRKKSVESIYFPDLFSITLTISLSCDRILHYKCRFCFLTWSHLVKSEKKKKKEKEKKASFFLSSFENTSISKALNLKYFDITGWMSVTSLT